MGPLSKNINEGKCQRHMVRRCFMLLALTLVAGPAVAQNIELERCSATAAPIRVLGASAAAASDLTGLFEIARFSDHPMDEDDRRRAIASVRRVEAEVAPR